MTAPAADNLAALAAAVLAVAPARLGGLWLRASVGPMRDAWLAHFKELAGEALPYRRMPAATRESRLLGGLDLAATLTAGHPVAERGLLAEAHGGVLQLAMAERLDPWLAGIVCGVMDSGLVQTEREGLTLQNPARFGLIALDEGINDERPPMMLTERLGLILDLDHTGFDTPSHEAQAVVQARRLLPDVSMDDAWIVALSTTAEALGVPSLRGPIHALIVARILAALDGRLQVGENDAVLAAALVLAPRATQSPQMTNDAPQDEEEQEPSDETPPPESANQSPSDENDGHGSNAPPDDLVTAAALATLPAGLLALMQARNMRSRSLGKSGAATRLQQRGRIMGSKPGDLRPGARIAVIDTLRAAAPWQGLRRGAHTITGTIAVRREDFRIVQRKARSRTTTIFVVDASGSSALQRLGEVKGAVQLLLSECYVRRDEVALIAFRGKAAEIVLPPTRALARASRALAGLAGGGGTPISHGIDCACALAESVLRNGATPVIVLMTDGRANIDRDGAAGREKALADAILSARHLAELRQSVIVIDTGAKPGEQALALARAMAARYVPLPHLNPQKLVDVIAADGRDRRAA